MADYYCKYSQVYANRIQPAIFPCTDFVPWQPSAESKLFLNAQPPDLLKTIGRPVPLNITFFQNNAPDKIKFVSNL